jgi:hypothetical protein
MTDIEQQVRAADNRFDRCAVPTVYEEYQVFLATGRYPYNDEVAKWIGERAGVPTLPYHNAPGWGLNGDWTNQLHHEIFLASRQRDVAAMVTKEAEALAQGFRPILELVPSEGRRIIFPDGKVYRLKAASNGDWALMAPRTRSWGISLKQLVERHQAFLTAKERGYPRHNSPSVVTYKEVVQPTRPVTCRVFDKSEGYWVPMIGCGTTLESIATSAMSQHPLFCSGPGQVEVRGVTFDYERIDPNGGNPPLFKLAAGTWAGHQDIYGRIT